MKIKKINLKKLKLKKIKISEEAKEFYYEAWQHFLTCRYAQARTQLFKACEVDPEWAQPHLLLGQSYHYDCPPDNHAAEREFRRVVELDPYWDEGYYWLSASYDALGSLDKAVKMVRLAMRLNPRDERYPITYGEYLMQQGKVSKAIKWFRRGLKLKPHYGEADYNLMLAEALLADGQIKAARKVWKFVLTLDPMYPSYKKPHKEARKRLKSTRNSQ